MKMLMPIKYDDRQEITKLITAADWFQGLPEEAKLLWVA
jgi:hypothetical protein